MPLQRNEQICTYSTVHVLTKLLGKVELIISSYQKILLGHTGLKYSETCSLSNVYLRYV